MGGGGGKGNETQAPSKPCRRLTRRLLDFLLFHQAALAYLVNQSGSLVYYYLLGSCGTQPTPFLFLCYTHPTHPHTCNNNNHVHPTTDISMAGPLCNSLTFVFTALTSHLLGERVDHPTRAALGVLLVLLGVTLCVASK